MAARGRAKKAKSIGRYVLHAEIASGGMAAVYFGNLVGPMGFSRVVAIKRMRQHLAADPQFVAMFLDEAWLAARVQHPNVVSTLDVVADAGELYIVMEYVRGQSLGGLRKDAKAQGLTVPVNLAVGIMAQVLAGLHAAHEATGEKGEPLCMVHRDVSPQNILVGVDGLARITDFGIAKAVNRLHETREHAVKGKLSYMPPEQIIGDTPIDRRADVFAAGVVLWELIAGKPLYRGANAMEIVEAMMTSRPPALSSLRPEVPQALDAVMERALSRDPKDRFETAHAFLVALEDATQPATSRAIGEWVQSLSGVEIAKRDAVVREIEATNVDRGGMLAALGMRPMITATSSDGPTVPRDQPGSDGRDAVTRREVMEGAAQLVESSADEADELGLSRAATEKAAPEAVPRLRSTRPMLEGSARAIPKTLESAQSPRVRAHTARLPAKSEGSSAGPQVIELQRITAPMSRPPAVSGRVTVPASETASGVAVMSPSWLQAQSPARSQSGKKSRNGWIGLLAVAGLASLGTWIGTRRAQHTAEPAPASAVAASSDTLVTAAGSEVRMTISPVADAPAALDTSASPEQTQPSSAPSAAPSQASVKRSATPVRPPPPPTVKSAPTALIPSDPFGNRPRHPR